MNISDQSGLRSDKHLNIKVKKKPNTLLNTNVTLLDKWRILFYADDAANVAGKVGFKKVQLRKINKTEVQTNKMSLSQTEGNIRNT